MLWRRLSEGACYCSADSFMASDIGLPWCVFAAVRALAGRFQSPYSPARSAAHLTATQRQDARHSLPREFMQLARTEGRWRGERA
jgi:hypothetical protein